MFTDNRHKGLAVYRAARAERKEIAILAKEVAKSNPDKSEEECRQLAAEIREARKRTADAEAQRQKARAQKKSRKGQHRAKGKGNGKVQHKRSKRCEQVAKAVEVIVVNRVNPNA